MLLESILTMLSLDTLKLGLRQVKGKVSEKVYKQLLSTAIAELLREVPDINTAQAAILAAEAVGAEPSADLLRAKQMLGRVTLYQRRRARAKKVRCASKTAHAKRCKRFTNGKSKYCTLHKKRR